MALGDLFSNIGFSITQAMTALMGSMFQIIPGYGQSASNLVNRVFQNVPLEAQILVRARQRNDISTDDYLDQMTTVGYDQSNAETLYESYLTTLNLQESLILYHRYKNEPDNSYGVSKDWLKQQFEKNSIDPRYLDMVIEANRPVPSLQDIILFADRDVFDPEIVSRLGLLEGLEQNKELLVEAQKRGLSLDDTKKYWASHWRPPSLQMAFEMLQRLSDHPDSETRFNFRDLELFHNIVETPPGIRKSLNAIAYNTLTRVDVRRMYRLGIFGQGEAGRQALIREYRTIGYSPIKSRPDGRSDAEIMADFTIKFESPQDRDLTRSQIERFYLDGVFDDFPNPVDEFKRRLADLGYIDSDIDLITEYIVNKRQEDENQEKLSIIEDEYIRGVITTESNLVTEIKKLDLPEGQVQVLTRRIIRKKKSGTKRITLSDLENAVRLGVLQLDDYKDRLKRDQYPIEDIDILAELLERESHAASNEPPLNDVLKWFAQSLIDENDFRSRLKKKGFSNVDIDLYVQQISGS